MFENEEAIFLLLMCCMLIIFSIVAILYLRNIKKIVKNISNWPTEKAEILKSVVGFDGFRMWGPRNLAFRPHVEYEYKVGEAMYHGSRISVFDGAYSGFRKKAVEEVIAHYPEGQGVTVYVRPNRPTYSLLTTDLTSKAKIQLGVYNAIAYFTLVGGIGGIFILLSQLLK